MKHKYIHVSAVLVLLIVLTLVFGVVGLAIGAGIGGNYGCIVYMGLPGYEGCGVLGSHIGLIVGGIVSIIVFTRSYKKIKNYG